MTCAGPEAPSGEKPQHCGVRRQELTVAIERRTFFLVRSRSYLVSSGILFDIPILECVHAQLVYDMFIETR